MSSPCYLWVAWGILFSPLPLPEQTAPTDPTLNRDNSKCERLCAPPTLLVFRPLVLIAEKGQSASIYLFSVLPSLRLNLLSFFPGSSFSSFLSDISLRHLSEIPFSILPRPGTLSFFREWLNHLGKQEQLRKLQATGHGLQQTFWGLPGRPRTCRVKKLIRSYLSLTSGSLRSLVLPLHTLCLGCQRERCTFGSKKSVSGPRDA